MTVESQQHWEAVYRDKDAQATSWFRPHLDFSLRLLERAGLDAQTRVIDVGGGASTLVDDLLARGVTRITVLDLSEASLRVAQQRLGADAARIEWRVADITQVELPHAGFDIWHDRAVLHFLTDRAAAQAYVRQATAALHPGAHAVIGGFAKDGPEQCSGLPVARRDPADIAALFGADFELIDEARETHVTPSGTSQSFAYALLRRRNDA
jgi:2-polyprenyl-3-methyl-5-hydroxy-6-metoxy-1,4-benzoquinol methylase